MSYYYDYDEDGNVSRFFMDAALYAMEGEEPTKAIENEERREQRSVVRNQRLPKRTNSGIPDELRLKVSDVEFTKQQYEKMGIKIVEEYDDLFYTVELPEGWEIKATDHSMWNNLYDEKGRKRADFFYKGVFYDRDAFINFDHRYSFDKVPFDDYKTNAVYQERKFKPWCLYVTDGGTRIEKLKETIASTNEEYFAMNDDLKNFGIQYLDENYPMWRDINAYWD